MALHTTTTHDKTVLDSTASLNIAHHNSTTYQNKTPLAKTRNLTTRLHNLLSYYTTTHVNASQRITRLQFAARQHNASLDSNTRHDRTRNLIARLDFTTLHSTSPHSYSELDFTSSHFITLRLTPRHCSTAHHPYPLHLNT